MFNIIKIKIYLSNIIIINNIELFLITIKMNNNKNSDLYLIIIKNE